MTSDARISLLLPTYGRAGELRRTLADVYQTLARPALCELLVYAVDGDQPTREVLEGFAHPRAARPPAVVYGPLTGYRGLPDAINLLAASAPEDTGWYFVLADDVGCLTEGWDDVIRQYDDTVPTLLTCENTAHNPLWFPVVSRPTYEALGVITASQFHDVWLDEVFRRAAPGNVHRAIPARFADRLVCSDSLRQLQRAERAAYEQSVECAARDLKAAMDSLERPAR